MSDVRADPRIHQVEEALQRGRAFVHGNLPDIEANNAIRTGGMTPLVLVEQRFLPFGQGAGLVDGERTAEELLAGAREGLRMARRYLETAVDRDVRQGAGWVVALLSSAIDVAAGK